MFCAFCMNFIDMPCMLFAVVNMKNTYLSVSPSRLTTKVTLLSEANY